MKGILEYPVNDLKYFSEKEPERNRFLLPRELEKLVQASRKTKAKFYLLALIYPGAEHYTTGLTGVQMGYIKPK